MNNSMSKEPIKTIFYNQHQALGAKFVSFHGFIMPLKYSSIVEEHRWVRSSCGVFDVSHMGKFHLSGDDSNLLMDKISPSKINDTAIGKVIYTAFLYEDGSPVDDVTVYHTGPSEWIVVVNCGNRDKVRDYILEKVPEYKKCYFRDITESHQQLALQGPESKRVLQEILGSKYIDLNYYEFAVINYRGNKLILSRTGYTGEDGFELYGIDETLIYLWRELLVSEKIRPVGLGARDSLRLEARYPLYGNEFMEGVNILECGLGWVINWNKDEFIGKEALLNIKENGPSRVLRGYVMEEPGVPRQGNELVDANGNLIGVVTSGGFSPTMKKGILLARVDTKAEDICDILLRGQRKKISRIKGPFVPNRTLKGKAGVKNES